MHLNRQPAIVTKPPVRGEGWLASTACCKPVHRDLHIAVDGVRIETAETFAIDWAKVCRSAEDQQTTAFQKQRIEEETKDRRTFLAAMTAGATALEAAAATTERPLGETGVPLQGSEPLPLGPLPGGRVCQNLNAAVSRWNSSPGRGETSAAGHTDPARLSGVLGAIQRHANGAIRLTAGLLDLLPEGLDWSRMRPSPGIVRSLAG